MLYGDGDGKQNSNNQKVHSMVKEIETIAPIDVDDKIERIQELIELQVNDRNILVRLVAL